MNSKKTILIIIIVLAAIIYFYLNFYKNNKKPIGSNNINVINFQSENQESPEGYKKFVSQNEKLIFFYKNDWECSEVVYDKRVDCYPIDRIMEEYDSGLDKQIVYYPDISIYDESDLCSLVVDQEELLKAEKEPLVYNEYGENYYGLFYKKFNNCMTKIITLPYIDSQEKLEEIIR
ncbi:hypothetical protein KKH39_03010 [Patescibacteria group bacterium]|nr:hypothetical protein [Patescibacteria group bacterium]